MRDNNISGIVMVLIVVLAMLVLAQQALPAFTGALQERLVTAASVK